MEDQYFLQPIHKQQFYNTLAFWMSLLGLGNYKWWNIVYDTQIVKVVFAVHSLTTKIFAPSSLISSVLFMLQNYNDMDFGALGVMFAGLPVVLIVNIKVASACFESYKKLMINFTDKIHLYGYYSKNKDQYIKEKLVEVEKYTRRTSYFLGCFILIDLCIWVIVPIINAFTKMDLVLNKTMRLQTCLYMWMPFDYAYDYEKWIFVHIFSTYAAGCGCVIVVIFDTINFAFVFNLIGHIKILKHSIRTGFTKDMSDEDVKMKLVELIKYHTFILETFKDLQSAFGINVAGNYLQNLLEDSLLLYELMFAVKEDKIRFGLMLIGYVGELILMSFVLEEIRIQSDGLPEVLYEVPWENMSIPNQKTFKLFLFRIQPILSFKAACNLKAGIQPMISILKSTFSYYVMLKSSVQDTH